MAATTANKKNVVSDEGTIGIRVTHRNGITGWIVGENGRVRLFKTKPAAQKWIDDVIATEKYSWDCETEITKFTGFTNQKEEIK